MSGEEWSMGLMRVGEMMLEALKQRAQTNKAVTIKTSFLVA